MCVCEYPEGLRNMLFSRRRRRAHGKVGEPTAIGGYDEDYEGRLPESTTGRPSALPPSPSLAPSLRHCPVSTFASSGPHRMPPS